MARRKPPTPVPGHRQDGRRPARLVVVVVLLLASVVVLGVAWRFRLAASPISGPIVLISIDTLRADHLPIYGYRAVRTPAIDALAAGGVVFENAYAHAPQTLPSHGSIPYSRRGFSSSFMSTSHTLRTLHPPGSRSTHPTTARSRQPTRSSAGS